VGRGSVASPSAGIDGMSVDTNGNVYGAAGQGPGGVCIISPKVKLGFIATRRRRRTASGARLKTLYRRRQVAVPHHTERRRLRDLLAEGEIRRSGKSGRTPGGATRPALAAKPGRGWRTGCACGRFGGTRWGHDERDSRSQFGEGVLVDRALRPSAGGHLWPGGALSGPGCLRPDRPRQLSRCPPRGKSSLSRSASRRVASPKVSQIAGAAP
jgi:hypothetical protein